jgi:hypothetical protein
LHSDNSVVSVSASNPSREQGLGAIVIDQSHALLIDCIASALLKIDDIVDFRTSMRDREVAEEVYSYIQ